MSVVDIGWRPSRRVIVGGLALAGAVAPLRADAAPSALKALAFDAFPIFDPRPIATLARSRFGPKGDPLTAL